MKHFSEDDKLTMVKYYINNKNVTYSSTCKVFNCSLRSIKRWVKIYTSDHKTSEKNNIHISTNNALVTF